MVNGAGALRRQFNSRLCAVISRLLRWGLLSISCSDNLRNKWKGSFRMTGKSNNELVIFNYVESLLVNAVSAARGHKFIPGLASDAATTDVAGIGVAAIVVAAIEHAFTNLVNAAYCHPTEPTQLKSRCKLLASKCQLTTLACVNLY